MTDDEWMAHCKSFLHRLFVNGALLATPKDTTINDTAQRSPKDLSYFYSPEVMDKVKDLATCFKKGGKPGDLQVAQDAVTKVKDLHAAMLQTPQSPICDLVGTLHTFTAGNLNHMTEAAAKAKKQVERRDRKLMALKDEKAALEAQVQLQKTLLQELASEAEYRAKKLRSQIADLEDVNVLEQRKLEHLMSTVRMFSP